ncbi:hypothetical protein PC120_g21295 [Phytophthora cactorum]|nr:hypothetical protein PC120_g21295 [Phytophthora cactorum]
MANGKRKVSFVQVIVSTKANERSHSAEDLHNEVEWVSEGGTFMTLMEVDDGTVDLSNDHWASCRMVAMHKASSSSGLSSSPIHHRR